MIDLIASIGQNPAPLLVVAVVIGIVAGIASPRPVDRRDRQRIFPATMRAEIIRRAGGRCENFNVLGWRCRRAATQADHVYPHSRGGRTELGNGCALCGTCNRTKSATVASPLWVWRLEQRRKRYFPPSTPRFVEKSRA